MYNYTIDIDHNIYINRFEIVSLYDWPHREPRTGTHSPDWHCCCGYALVVDAPLFAWTGRIGRDIAVRCCVYGPDHLCWVRSQSSILMHVTGNRPDHSELSLCSQLHAVCCPMCRFRCLCWCVVCCVVSFRWLSCCTRIIWDVSHSMATRNVVALLDGIYANDIR